jgi:hypothetical protein
MRRFSLIMILLAATFPSSALAQRFEATGEEAARIITNGKVISVHGDSGSFYILTEHRGTLFTCTVLREGITFCHLAN